MDPERCLEVVRTESSLLAEAGRRVPTAPVVACPGWDVQALVGHVGAVQGWVTAKLHGDPTLSRFRGDWTPPPPADGDWPGWFGAITDRLIEALATLPAETSFDSWAGDQPVAFWQRRMAQEVSVHRWDGEAAVGAPSPIPVDVAADGIDELLSWFLAKQVDRRAIATMAPWSMTIDPVDAAPSWRVQVEPAGVSVAEGAAASDVVVQGSASDLLLWCWNRPTQAGLTFEGDGGKAEQWNDVLHV
jgi:uncharacterized protein (TIGR03083 family)